MSEPQKNGYKQLLEVRILHHYWLDEGSVLFDLISDQPQKNRRLFEYDMKSFLAVRPTIATAKLLDSFGCLFRETNLGFFVAAPDGMILPTDTVFDFMVTVKDSRFSDYTALTLRPQKIYEFYNKLDKTIYRYKENVPFLSNLKGATREKAGIKLLFLSREPPPLTGNDKIESLLLSGSALVQLISDDQNILPQQLSADAGDYPVFLHQGDVPAIVPPEGLSGVPERGIRLTNDITDEVVALLSLTALCPSNNAFSFVDVNGSCKTVPPAYQVRFKSRSTFWSYLDKTTGAVDSIETSPLPLTNFGNAGTKKKPSDGLVKAEKNGSEIIRLISEIYV